MDFHIEEEAKKIKAKLAKRKKKKYAVSKLDQWKPELLSLRREGITLEGLQIWLREKKIICNISTISRWLKNEKRKHG